MCVMTHLYVNRGSFTRVTHFFFPWLIWMRSRISDSFALVWTSHDSHINESWHTSKTCVCVRERVTHIKTRRLIYLWHAITFKWSYISTICDMNCSYARVMSHIWTMCDMNRSYARVMSHIWTICDVNCSYVYRGMYGIHMHESCRTYKPVTSIYARVMSHVAHMHESCLHMHESWVMSHIWTNMTWESRHKCARVKSHIWTSHVSRMNELCHTREWDRLHKRIEATTSHIRMRHVSLMKESCHAFIFMSHIRMSHASHTNASCLAISRIYIYARLRDMMHSYARHDTFICVIWIWMRDVTHLYARLRAFICEAWHIHMCDMNMNAWHLYARLWIRGHICNVNATWQPECACEWVTW